jgi:hypothetical protein
MLTESTGIYAAERPGVRAMMELVSAETEARLTRASRAYVRLKRQLDDARAELAAAIVAERREGTLIEDITARVPYRQTQVNRVLEAAGLTEKRAPRAS